MLKDLHHTLWKLFSRFVILVGSKIRNHMLNAYGLHQTPWELSSRFVILTRPNLARQSLVLPLSASLTLL